MTGPEEFWAAVDRSGGPDACWPWLLSRFNKRRGYGQVNWQGRIQRAHRVAYTLTTGLALSPSEPLDHTCHDPNTCIEPCAHTACCNPVHLELVTQTENNRRRTRQTCGQGHPKTAEHGRVRRNGKWTCRTCETASQRHRRAVA